ncbi:DUF7079 family protein [Permianibacter aggregans]|uniref:DUF7079 domain-containing protein n=1 Tax=Permianibacter aggregans TaxID=1510150 RepID=A0A4R6UNM9_9GAMM|nr:hypothetical protein [Permianibacter aggregans]QGX40764.1 hypothetical protein E2H98_14295 [Permianibacter aggregans]TDQ48422.1 hypothetical protein EV696_107159 [Permianibacter aggregans]
MLEPEQDLEQRLPVWDALQMLFMDTDVTFEYESITRICAASSYTIAELEAILFNEVLPAVRFNMFLFPAPEWTGFEREWLKNRVLKKHRFGKRKPLLLRWYTHCHWHKLKAMIEQQRNS